MQTVLVAISGGPSATVEWFQDMNAQQALESAFDDLSSMGDFTYALQYYGSQLGYLVVMINETFDTFMSSSHPYFYWNFSLNGVPANAGIDGVTLNPGDTIGFAFETYSPEIHAGTTVETKHQLKQP